VGRGVGYLMQGGMLIGTAKDIETIAKLRPWMEDEAREKYGYKGKSRLVTEYNKESETFSFSIIFDDESRD
jgi:hypothetical protein